MEDLETLKSLFDKVSDGVFISNGHGHILYMNPAAERMIEMTVEEAKRGNICELLCGHLEVSGAKECASTCPLRRQPVTPGGDYSPGTAGKDVRPLPAAQWAVTFNGDYHRKPSFEWRNLQISRLARNKGLRVRCLQVPAVFSEVDQERHFTIVEDVSAERELEHRKEDWRNMVEHDLRIPLTSVIAALGTLAEVPDGQVFGSSEKSLISIGLRAGKAMLSLLNDQLDLAKLDAGKMKPRLVDVDAYKLLKKCVEEQTPTAKTKAVEVTLDVPESLTVRADEGLLFRVMQNLLNNALKFTPESGSVRITTQSILSMIQITFKDSGPGIAPEDIFFIFDRYYQAESRWKGKMQGTGLGLTFCHEAMNAMGGQISVESTPSHGAEFSILLPASSNSNGQSQI